MCEPTEKLIVAIELLDRALGMYYEGNSYYAALHLAGAAEEILGVYVERSGDESSFKSLQRGAVVLSKVINDGVESSPQEIAAIMNHAKNRTKHMDKEKDDHVRFDPKIEARDLLGRAISNYYTLMRHYSLPETEFINKFYLELIGRNP